MSSTEIRNLAVALGATALVAAPAAAQTGSKLRISAARHGALVSVSGKVTPAGYARRVVVQVRKAGDTLAQIEGPLHRDGTFSTRVELLADPGPIRVVVTAGRLHLSRTLT